MEFFCIVVLKEKINNWKKLETIEKKWIQIPKTTTQNLEENFGQILQTTKLKRIESSSPNKALGSLGMIFQFFHNSCELWVSLHIFTQSFNSYIFKIRK
jgi:hypothetical protein